MTRRLLPFAAVAAALSLVACADAGDGSGRPAGAAAAPAAPPAQGQVAGGQVAEGRAIADRLCSGCHATGPAGTSPEAAAPPFRTLGQRWPVEYLAEALAEGIIVGHEADVRMPEFRFEPAEIDALLAYLESLQPAGSGPG